MRTEHHSESIKIGVKWCQQKTHRDELFMNPQNLLKKTVKYFQRNGVFARNTIKIYAKMVSKWCRTTTLNAKTPANKGFL